MSDDQRKKLFAQMKEEGIDSIEVFREAASDGDHYYPKGFEASDGLKNQVSDVLDELWDDEHQKNISSGDYGTIRVDITAPNGDEAGKIETDYEEVHIKGMDF